MDGARRKAGFYVRAAVFAGFVVFLYVPIAVIAVLSFQGPLGGMTFPMSGFSFECMSTSSTPDGSAISAPPSAARWPWRWAS